MLLTVHSVSERFIPFRPFWGTLCELLPQTGRLWLGGQALPAPCVSGCPGRQKQAAVRVVCSRRKDKTPLLWFFCNPRKRRTSLSLSALCAAGSLSLSAAVIRQSRSDEIRLTPPGLVTHRQRQHSSFSPSWAAPGRGGTMALGMVDHPRGSSLFILHPSPCRGCKLVLKGQFMNMDSIQ